RSPPRGQSRVEPRGEEVHAGYSQQEKVVSRHDFDLQTAGGQRLPERGGIRRLSRRTVLGQEKGDRAGNRLGTVGAQGPEVRAHYGAESGQIRLLGSRLSPQKGVEGCVVRLRR